MTGIIDNICLFDRHRAEVKDYIISAISVIVTFDCSGLCRAAIGNNKSTIVQYSCIFIARSAVKRKSVKVKSEVFICVDNNIFSNPRKEHYGLTVGSRCNCFGKGFITYFADFRNVCAFFYAVRSVFVLGRDKSVCAIFSRNCTCKRSAAYSHKVSLGEFAFDFISPIVSLDCIVAGFCGKLSAGDNDVRKTFITRSVYNGNCRAVLDCAVVFRLGNRVARNGNCRACIDVKLTAANLNAHGFSVNRRFVDRKSAAAREVNSEAVGNVKRTVYKRYAVIGVITVRFDTAAAV